MTRRLRMIGIPLLALSLVLGTAGLVSAQQTSVQAADDVFQPQTVEVEAGTTVTWTNTGQNPHTVTANDGSFGSGTLAPGQTFSMTFDTAGTVGYYCEFHGTPTTGMFGSVVATAAPAPEPAPPAPEPAAPAPEPAPAEPAEPAPEAAPAPAGGVSFVIAALALAGLGLALLASGFRLRRR